MKRMTSIVLMVLWAGCEAQTPPAGQEMEAPTSAIDIQGLAAEDVTGTAMPAKEVVLVPTEASAAIDFSEVAMVKRLLPAEALQGRMSLAASPAGRKILKTAPPSILPLALQGAKTTAAAPGKRTAAGDKGATDLAPLLEARGLAPDEGVGVQGLYLQLDGKPEARRKALWGKK